MASGKREKFDNPVVEWIDERLPVFTMMQKEYGVFPTPKNFNYFWKCIMAPINVRENCCG